MPSSPPADTRLQRLHGNVLISCSQFVFETASLVICYVFEPSPPCDPPVSTCIVEGPGTTLAWDAERAHRKDVSCNLAVSLA